MNDLDPPPKTIFYRRLVDLSHPIDVSIPLWPGDPPVEICSVATLAEDGYFLRRLTIGEHSGTHINAPAGFYAQGAGVEAFAPESLVVPAVVLDVRRQAEEHADYLLTAEDTSAWERRHGVIPAGALVLLNTGWSRCWGEPAAFLGYDAAGGMHFPGFGRAAAEHLLARREVAGLGIDTHGVDGGQDTEFAVNRLVLGRPGLLLENLANLDQLPATGITLVIGILHVRGGAGSPAAVLAFVS